MCVGGGQGMAMIIERLYRHAILRSTADPDADLEGNLADWRRFRRQKRVADVHWIDVVYQAYLTGIFGLVVVVVLSSMVGDEVLTVAQVDTVRAEGPGWIGVAAAFAVALGLRSGSRGGPLALERAEVRHVLLAPVDRRSALRVPALKQLRFLAFVGLVVGGIAGNLAAQRMPGIRLAWIATRRGCRWCWSACRSAPRWWRPGCGSLGGSRP